MRHSAVALAVRTAPTPPPPSAAAFALVRQLLAERPRHFRELLADGVALQPGANAASSSSKPADKAPEKSKRRKGEQEVVDVPAGHPFVSGTYLKKRILPVLESQALISKEWLTAAPGTPLARHHADKKHAMWAIQTDGTAGGRWERLASGAPVSSKVLGELGYQAHLEREAAEAAAREAAFASGEVERLDREVLVWAGRPAGFTNRLERTHLNVRRARARDAKEARRVQADDRRDAQRVPA